VPTRGLLERRFHHGARVDVEILEETTSVTPSLTPLTGAGASGGHQ
jgi:hypothetical protein